MRVDQRNAGASVATTGLFPVDRFVLSFSGGVLTVQRSTTAPDNFTNSLYALASTADTSVAAGDFYAIQQRFEGLNVSHLGYGTSSAKTTTLSFWVRSSITGTYCIGLTNGANNRSYVAEYTINSANTWEQKSITITGDTSGTWVSDNTNWGRVRFGLGGGTNSQTTANSWQTGNYYITSNQTNWIGTLNATFYITGVQLEVGDTATPFEHRPYDMELARCQRYYYKEQATFAGQYFAPNAYAIGTTSAFTFNTFPVPMRTRPTALEQSGTASDYSLVRCGAGTFTICNSVPTFGGSSLTIGQCVFNVASGLSNGFAGSGMSQSTNAYLAWSAEL